MFQTFLVFCIKLNNFNPRHWSLFTTQLHIFVLEILPRSYSRCMGSLLRDLPSTNTFSLRTSSFYPSFSYWKTARPKSFSCVRIELCETRIFHKIFLPIYHKIYLNLNVSPVHKLFAWATFCFLYISRKWILTISSKFNFRKKVKKVHVFISLTFPKKTPYMESGLLNLHLENSRLKKQEK